MTPCTIEKIIKLLRCAFHQAVRWEIIGKNPFEDTGLPNLVFHSLRYSSMTYKLKLNKGFETAFNSNPDMRPVERSLQGKESSSVPNPDIIL